MHTQLRDATRSCRPPLVRRIGLVVVAVALVGATPRPASAQFLEFMDWLDKLSGPGPFKPTYPLVPSVSIPIACISEVTTRPGLKEAQVVTALSAATTDLSGRRVLGPGDRIRFLGIPERVRHQFELAPQCLGLFGVFRATNPNRVPWSSTGDLDAILRKKNRVGFELNLARLSSAANDLEGYSPALSEDAKQVEIFVWGVSLRYFAYDFAYVKLAWNRHHFYSKSDLFDSFDRSAGVAELGFKPLYWGHKWGRPLTVSAGFRQGLGQFTAGDFGASGPYQARDEWTPTLRIGYDIWWLPCLMDLCSGK